MATPIQGKPGVAPKPAAAATSGIKASMGSSGAFSSEQLSPDANAFPPLYEAAILYAADCYEAAQETLRELRTLPRIATGKCQLGCMGMRIDGRTRNGAALHEWAETQAIPHLGTIRLAQAYSKCMERGWSIFDFPIEKVATYREEWQGLTHWLDLLLSAAPAAPGSHLARPEISRPPSSLILRPTDALQRA